MKQIDLYDVNMNYLYTYSLIGKGAPYFNHTRQVQIADSDNGRLWQDNFNFDVKINEDTDDVLSAASFFIWSDTNDRQYLYRIQNKSIIAGSTHTPTETITAVNAFAVDLPGHIEAKEFKNPTAKQVFEYITAGSGWNLHKVDEMSTGTTTFSIDTSNETGSLSSFVSAVAEFNAEVDAWIDFDQFGNMVKNVDIVKHLYPIVDTNFADIIDIETGTVLDDTDVTELVSENNGRTLSYYNGLAGFTRTEDWTNVYTKFWVSGYNGANISSVNGGKQFIVDDNANDLYNGGRDTYLEGSLVSDTIAQPKALLQWAEKEKTKYNHPAYTYEITTEYMNSEDMPNRGETLLVINFDVTPALIVLAEVISSEIHDDNQANNSVTLGEFRTLTPTLPSLINGMNDDLNNEIKKIIDELKNGTKQATVGLITPTGKSWSQDDDSKVIIARVFVDGTNITTYLSPSAFNWTKTDLVTGVHDLDWEQKHFTDGYQVTLSDGDIGNFTCTIEGDFLKTEAELSVDPGGTLFWDKKRADFPKDHWGDKIQGAFQYMWFDEVHQQLITSVAYDYGTPGQDNRTNATDTKYHRFDMKGNYIDSMIVQGGGHGSSFGARLVNDVPEIWTSSTNPDGANFCLSKFSWQSNKVIKQDNGLVKVAKMPGINGRYFRRISVDFEQGWVLSVMSSGPIEVLKLSDINKGVWNAMYSFTMQQMGFNPVAETEPNFNVMQSNEIHFPYIFLNSGNYKGQDPRILSCINVVTESEVFRKIGDISTFGNQWINNYFEPETVGYYHNDGNPYLLLGFMMETLENSKDVYMHRVLFKTPIMFRDDSGDEKNYITEDVSHGEGDAI